MRILLLNQAFYPDVVASGQYLTDLALGLAERGHAVTVITGRRAYDDPNILFQKSETWRGVKIVRVASTGFGKGAKWKRATDFASYFACCCAKLMTLPRHEIIVGMTSPPLISFFAALLARIWRSRFIYWVMDLNPDEAIAAGWLRNNSFAGRVLDWMSRFSLKEADRVIVLDRFMHERILRKGVGPDKVTVIPPWSHDDAVNFDAVGREQFRRRHGLEDKFVVMYSGNHSPCHSLDTLLRAASALKKEQDIAFCFVGGGSEFARVKDFGARHQLSNFVCLPYQPRDQIAGSLSAADVHVVVMGDAFVGITHPCKIYNALRVSAPVLCIGPKPCHLTEVLEEIGPSQLSEWAPHGDAKSVAQKIRRIQRQSNGHRNGFDAAHERYSRQALLPRLMAELENAR